jgi:hypothetical protein
MMENRKQADAYRFLMASVIERAIDDLKGIGPKCRRAAETDQAMAFILSDTYEAWCLELKIDYERIREKAVGLYQRFLAKNDQETGRKKRTGKPAKHPKGVQIRKVIAKPLKRTYR